MGDEGNRDVLQKLAKFTPFYYLLFGVGWVVLDENLHSAPAIALGISAWGFAGGPLVLLLQRKIENDMPGSPEALPLEAPTHPYVTVSRHTAVDLPPLASNTESPMWKEIWSLLCHALQASLSCQYPYFVFSAEPSDDLSIA